MTQTISPRALTVSALLLAFGCSCAPLNPGVSGTSAVTHPAIDGTVFTIVFENENADDVLTPRLPTFYDLSNTYGRADAYISDHHPSLANYVELMSGDTHGISNSNGPLENITVSGSENLPQQLEDAGITWRAYMETMGEPCRMTSAYPYVVNHDPFTYFHSLTDDPERCRERVVDFDAHFAEDLASNAYRYMWITPNNCSNMHDCVIETGDAFLARVLPQIMASPGYLNNGVVFILFDEGYLRVGSAAANLATLVISPQLVSPNYVTNTRFDHRSYLATVQDIFGLPRFATTVDAVPMSEFLVSR